MHTFFINTSGREIEQYSNIMEIPHETRKLVTLDCPISSWCDGGTSSFEACAIKMGEMIDSYKDINNDFILVVYVDLFSFKEYASIPYSELRERDSAYRSLRVLARHYIYNTIVSKLSEYGRTPRETLVIFEKSNDRDANVEAEVNGHGMPLIYSKMLQYMGFPEADAVNAVAGSETYEAADNEAKKQMLTECVLNCEKGSILGCLKNTFEDEIDLFAQEFIDYKSFETARELFVKRIFDNGKKNLVDFYDVPFVTDRRAAGLNKQENTKRGLRLCFYLLECIRNKTVLMEDGINEQTSEKIYRVKPFEELNWDEIYKVIASKHKTYEKKFRETSRLSDNYSELKLSPRLLALNRDLFGLDEFGGLSKKFEVVAVDEKKDKKKSEKEDTDAPVKSDAGKSAVVIQDVDVPSLFTPDEFSEFDYNGEKVTADALNPKATPDQFVESAVKLREHHINYLKRLRVHVTDVLSNYAGRSKENRAAILTKRDVSVADEDVSDEVMKHRYAVSETTYDDTNLDNVREVALQAYSTAQMEYLKFMAARSVAITDIEDQCNWFVTRVHQIKESLRKLKIVALGLLIAIIMLYLPYIIVQWEMITKNLISFSHALYSFLIPMAILYVVFGFVSAWQKKQYFIAWKEFEAKSREILEDNSMAARKFDKMLSVYIPSLRWLYEYKMDVDFCADCCDLAKAKVNHHLQKMHDLLNSAKNLLEDLEVDEDLIRLSESYDMNVDYNCSYCTDKDNCDFYSVIDEQMLKKINK